jgi:predicted metal-dependent hydrolase
MFYNGRWYRLALRMNTTKRICMKRYAVKRHCPARELPPYSYVPGKWPHPISDPKGHSFAHRPPALAATCMSDWRHCDEWLFGIDLFQHGFYWEAHESWEAVWQALGRNSDDAHLVKSLIKLAAAGVKARENNAEGVRKHARRCAELASSEYAHAHSRRFGVDWDALSKLAESAATQAETLCRSDHERVTIIFDFGLPLDY